MSESLSSLLSFLHGEEAGDGLNQSGNQDDDECSNHKLGRSDVLSSLDSCSNIRIGEEDEGKTFDLREDVKHTGSGKKDAGKSSDKRRRKIDDLSDGSLKGNKAGSNSQDNKDDGNNKKGKTVSGIAFTEVTGTGSSDEIHDHGNDGSKDGSKADI